MRLINVWLQTSNHGFLLLREFDFGRTLFFCPDTFVGSACVGKGMGEML